MTLLRIIPLIIFWVKSKFLAGTERAKVGGWALPGWRCLWFRVVVGWLWGLLWGQVNLPGWHGARKAGWVLG
jgi:hypothetical protein